MTEDKSMEESTIFNKEFKILGIKIRFHLCNELWYNDIQIKGGELGAARTYNYLSVSKITHPDLDHPLYSIILFVLEIWINKK